MSKIYKILGEKYESLYTENREIRRVPFGADEKKILVGLFDFIEDKHDIDSLHRIPYPALIQNVFKYSDNTFVLMQKDDRGITKFEYTSFYKLAQRLEKVYHANQQLRNQEMNDEIGTRLAPNN